jgi:hypothetical protein
MANKKAENSNKTQVDPSGSMSEESPSPHGESKVLKMPINTDQRNATGGRNVPQVPNTVGGKLNLPWCMSSKTVSSAMRGAIKRTRRELKTSALALPGG